MSDRIAVMNAGRVEQVGRPEEVYERPANRFVADFLGETNFLEGTVVEVAEAGTAMQTGTGMRIRVGAGETRRPGDSIAVAIRPERIRLNPSGTLAGQGHPGAIAEAIYVGDVRRYQVLLEGGERLVAKEPNLGGRILAKGDRVEVAWRPEDARVIHGDEGTGQ